MFQFGRFPSPSPGMTVHYHRRVSPFGYLRLLRSYTPHRSFSQYNTSFLGARYLGIHCVPLVAFRTIVRNLRLSWHALLGITFALIILLLRRTRRLLQLRRSLRTIYTIAPYTCLRRGRPSIPPPRKTCGDKGTRTLDLVSAIDALSQTELYPPSGDKGTRTPDLLGANEALSQLSYIPIYHRGASKT